MVCSSVIKLEDIGTPERRGSIRLLATTDTTDAQFDQAFIIAGVARSARK